MSSLHEVLLQYELFSMKSLALAFGLPIAAVSLSTVPLC